MSALTPPLKWHGGKHYVAQHILGNPKARPPIPRLMPRHRHYVEPFFGGGAVLLARDPEDPSLWVAPSGEHSGVSEVVNDINGRLVNFWRVLRDEETFPHFQRAVPPPLCRPFWDEAHNHAYGQGRVADAVAFFVDCRQSLAGRMDRFTSLTRNRTRRHMNGNASEWLSAVDGLAAVHERLRRVVIENMDAVKLILREDTPDTLFYCDPPYPKGTRTAPEVYGAGACEMTDDQHRELLATLLAVKGKVILSSYPSEMYTAALAGWSSKPVGIANHASGGKTKRRMTEMLWWNW